MRNRPLRCVIFTLFFGATCILAIGQTTPPVIDEAILEKIAREVSGSICFEHVRYLTTLHRIWGSGDYHRAAQYFVEKSREYGLHEATIEEFPVMTGKESFWMHSTGGNVPWNLKRGEFRLVEPFPMLITHHESAPSTVARGSRSAETEAELIYVGRGDSEKNYQGLGVGGKIVLAEGGRHDRVQELAVHHFGALGTVQFYNASGNYWESEGIYWANINPWSDDGQKASTFGINISSSQGNYLKDLCASNKKVIVSVKIEAEVVKEGVYELATSIIPGTARPEEEFIFYAHLDHPKPGAHDNASGDAVLLEIARTLSSLITKKIIPPPTRTIRFMWIPHMSGLNMYFFYHQDKLGKIKAGCNIDCVGANQMRFPTQFHVALPPHSLPTFLTDITQNLIDYMNWMISHEKNPLFSPEGSRNMFLINVSPYQGASDEYTANTRSMNIPSIYFYDSPLPPRHNQINFLEYIDRTNLNRVAYLGAIISYAFAAVREEMVPQLIYEVGYRGKDRLEKELLKAKSLIESSTALDIHKNYAQAKSLLSWGIKREKGMGESLGGIVPEKEYLRLINAEHMKLLDLFSAACLNQLKKHYELKCRALNIKPQRIIPEVSDPRWQKTIPVLNPDIKGSIGYFSNYLEDRLGNDFLQRYKGVRSSIKYGNVGYYEALNYVDGWNSIADIFEAVQAEFWSEDYPEFHHLAFEEMANFFLMLEDAEVITFKER